MAGNRWSPGVLLVALLAACAPLAPPPAAPAPPAYVSSEPPNVGDAKIVAKAYHDSAAYERDLTAVTAAAAAWLQQRAPQVPRAAMVLDVDETALSNWVIIQASDFSRVAEGPCNRLPEGPCGWSAWGMLGRDPAITPTLQLYRQARDLNVTVFFISGRPESQRAATERNLRDVGYTFRRVFLTRDGATYASAADFKAPRREEIEQAGYTIVANVGDQPSDLAGGHAEKTFLLPNPFYRIP